MANLRTGVAAAVVMAALGGAAAAGKPPKNTSTAAEVAFRCTADAMNQDDPCLSTDGVQDAGESYTGGSIASNGMYMVHIAPAAERTMSLSFGALQEGSRECEMLGNCNPDPLASSVELTSDIDLRAMPLLWDNEEFVFLPGGLFQMNCDATYEGLVHLTFWLPGGDGHWGLNFNQMAYPETDNVAITRVTDTTWTVEASETDVAELLSWSHSNIRGKRGPSREGRFHMPFRFTITATGALPSDAVLCPTSA